MAPRHHRTLRLGLNSTSFHRKSIGDSDRLAKTLCSRRRRWNRYNLTDCAFYGNTAGTSGGGVVHMLVDTNRTSFDSGGILRLTRCDTHRRPGFRGLEKSAKIIVPRARLVFGILEIVGNSSRPSYRLNQLNRKGRKHCPRFESYRASNIASAAEKQKQNMYLPSRASLAVRTHL